MLMCLQRAVDPEAETEDDSDGDGEPENGIHDRVSKALGGTATRGKERISKRVCLQNPILLCLPLFGPACYCTPLAFGGSRALRHQQNHQQ